MYIRGVVNFYSAGNVTNDCKIGSWLEVGRAWARRSGLGFLLHKTQSLRVRLGPKPNFFIYIVKPESKVSPTYFVNFSSPKYEVWARKNQAQPTSTPGHIAGDTKEARRPLCAEDTSARVVCVREKKKSLFKVEIYSVIHLQQIRIKKLHLPPFSPEDLKLVPLVLNVEWKSVLHNFSGSWISS
jgi:hypothetical protein